MLRQEIPDLSEIPRGYIPQREIFKRVIRDQRKEFINLGKEL